jgi:hypothetical protein
VSAATYAELVERGCLCGSDSPQDCSLHGPRDNRGLAAYFKAGMPRGFPLVATCTLCGDEGLLYPSVELDCGDVPAGEAPGPTLICPRCSRPTLERALRAGAESFGYELNARTVFAMEAAA